jgi:hypothetical protein
MTMKLKDKIIITLGAVFMTILSFISIAVGGYLSLILIDLILKMFGR